LLPPPLIIETINGKTQATYNIKMIGSRRNLEACGKSGEMIDNDISYSSKIRLLTFRIFFFAFLFPSLFYLDYSFHLSQRPRPLNG
jgi:hypothetical protein